MDDRRSSIDARRNANFEEGPYGWWLMGKTCGGHVNLKLGGGAQRVVARAAAKNWCLSKLPNLPKFLDYSDRTTVYTRQHHTSTLNVHTARFLFVHIQESTQLYLSAFVHVPVRDIQPKWRCVSGAGRNAAPNSPPSMRTRLYWKLLG
jgi:hypothetical protein